MFDTDVEGGGWMLVPSHLCLAVIRVDMILVVVRVLERELAVVRWKWSVYALSIAPARRKSAKRESVGRENVFGRLVYRRWCFEIGMS